MSTKVICKTDCEFCQNEERVCRLDIIEVSQTQPKSPILHCQQYVQAITPNRRNSLVDFDRARAAGSFEAVNERLAQVQ